MVSARTYVVDTISSSKHLKLIRTRIEIFKFTRIRVFLFYCSLFIFTFFQFWICSLFFCWIIYYLICFQFEVGSVEQNTFSINQTVKWRKRVFRNWNRESSISTHKQSSKLSVQHYEWSQTKFNVVNFKNWNCQWSRYVSI